MAISLPWLIGLICALQLASTPLLAASGYDPTRQDAAFSARIVDLNLHDARRQRDIPLRVYLPATQQPAPVVLFSHGLGGSREGSAFMGQTWAAHGFVVVALQHAGSDAAVWQDVPKLQRWAAMRKAASAENLILRAADVSATLDQLTQWHTTPGHALAGRLDLQRIGMSGHSFGALTTQAVSGQTYRRSKVALGDPRIKASIAFSPSITGRATAADFANIHTPWLSMTGTLDKSPIGQADVAERIAVYAALPPGNKYQLVLDGAEHSAFTDRALPGDKAPRNPNHHRAILAISTAFWDAYLRDDAEAKRWLSSEKVRQVLQSADRWNHK